MNAIYKIAVVALAVTVSQSAFAEFGGQVFYQYGYANLATARSNQVFTDVSGAAKQDGKTGWNVGAGLDLPMLKAVGPGDISGEVMLDYSHYSKKTTTQATSALLGSATTKEITVSTLNVLVAPKYKFTGLLAGGKVTPWIIPVGLSFLVNSPPSDNTTYLDIGYHAGLGIEYKVIENLSLGIDYRTTISMHEIDTDNTNSTTDLFVAINF